MHRGIDIAAEVGTPVAAAASGKVIFAGVKIGYGLVVEIEHSRDLLTRYAHLDTCAVAVGRQVASGDLIGTVGESGRATGANLHFETVVRGRTVDPLPLLGLDWRSARFAYRSPLVMRPRPGVFARFTPQPQVETRLAPATLPVPK